MSKGSVKFTLDDAIFQKKIRDLAKRVGVDEKEFVQQQGGLFLREIAKRVPPFVDFGKAIKSAKIGSAEDFKAGKRAIIGDLAIIFKQRERGYLEFIHRTTGMKRNVRQTLRTKKGVPYLVDVDFINYDSVGEALDFHENRRRADGRVKGKQKGGKSKDIGRWQSRNVMWITPEIWAKVVQTLTARVGRAKASVSQAMQRIDKKRRRNSPKWVNKHIGSVSGNGRMAKIGGAWNAVFSMNEKGLQAVTRNKLEFIRKFRLKEMEKALMRKLRADAKKSGFRVK